MSGNKSEIVNRCFVNMVRLHHCWSASCASNDEFGANRPAVTGSRRGENDHQVPLPPTAAGLILHLRRCTAQLRQLRPAFPRSSERPSDAGYKILFDRSPANASFDDCVEVTLFDREGYDEVAGKRPLRTLGSSAEWRGVVQGRVVANLRPDNEAFDLFWDGRLDGKSEGQRTVGRRSTTNRYAKWIAMFNPHKIQIAGKRGNEEAVIVAPDLSASSDLEPIVDRIGGVLGHTAARRVKPIITNIVSVGRQGELVGCLPDDGNVIEIT